MRTPSGGRGPETEIVVARVFDAPRALVWRAWTEAEHYAAWAGPAGFRTRVEAHDFRPGGTWRYVMIGPDGTEYPSTGVFLEIDPPARIVSTDEFAEGFEAPAGTELPSGIVVTVLFEDLGATTRVTVRMSHPSLEDRRRHEDMGVVAGWESMLDELAAYLTKL